MAHTKFNTCFVCSGMRDYYYCFIILLNNFIQKSYISLLSLIRLFRVFHFVVLIIFKLLNGSELLLLEFFKT